MNMKRIIMLGLVLLVIVAGLAGWKIIKSGELGMEALNSTPPAVTQVTPGAGGYTMTEVRTHGDASSCWSAINGKVYDLTSWINQHPGGPDKILGVCGSDGSMAFNSQHSGQGEPTQVLSSFYIGDLKN